MFALYYRLLLNRGGAGGFRTVKTVTDPAQSSDSIHLQSLTLSN